MYWSSHTVSVAGCLPRYVYSTDVKLKENQIVILMLAGTLHLFQLIFNPSNFNPNFEICLLHLNVFLFLSVNIYSELLCF